MKIIMLIRMVDYANYVIQAVKHALVLYQHSVLVVQLIWL